MLPLEIVPYALSNFSGSTNFELHTDIGACSKIALTHQYKKLYAYVDK